MFNLPNISPSQLCLSKKFPKALMKYAKPNSDTFGYLKLKMFTSQDAAKLVK